MWVKGGKTTKWLMMMVCLALVFALAACGSSGGSGGNDGKTATDEGNKSDGSGTKTSGSDDSGKQAPKSNVKLSLWHWKVAFDPGFKAVADAFEKKTGIKVETQTTTPDETYRQKLTAASSAGNLPDLFAYWAGPAEGAYDGVAMEWSQELSGDADWKNSFFPAALSGVTVQQANIDAWAKDEKSSKWKLDRKPGEIYGIPIDVGAFYTVYGNAKMLKEAGIATDAPATIEEWLQRMKTVKEKTNKPGFIFTAKTFSVYENWMTNLVDYMKNGPDEYTKFLNRDAKMSDPAHIHFAKFIEDITKDGLLIPGSVNLDIDPADQAFSQGKGAYLLGGTFTYASLAAMGMNMDDVISFRVPAYEGSQVADAKVAPFPLVQMVVNSKGAHAKEAADFVKFLTSEEGITLYANGAFDIPSVNLKDKSQLKPAINSMISSLSSESNWWSENSAISNKVFGPEWQAFHQDVQRIILGEMTAAKAAENFDKNAAAEKAKEQK